MALYLEYESNAFRMWHGEAVDGVTHPRDIERLWTAEELAAVGLYSAATAEDVPSGKVITATSVQRVGGVVRFVHALADAPQRPVPQSISPLQARKALRLAGYKTAVDAYVGTLSEEDQEEWEYATEVRRDNAVIAAGAVALQLTEPQVDDLFRLGETL